MRKYSFFQGMLYLADGFDLITKPGLRRFVIIPFLINISFFIGFFYTLRYFLFQFNAWFINHLPHWLYWLSTILWLLFLGGFILIFLYTFMTMANIFAAPFNSVLAEKVAFYLTGNISPSLSFWTTIKDIPRVIGRQFAIIGYYLPRALILFLLFFIPVIQSVAAIFWFLFNAWFLTLTYIDYPTDNYRIPLRAVRRWLKEHYLLSYGFGMSVLVMSMIPVINFFVIPAAVAGATKCWVEQNKDKKI